MVVGVVHWTMNPWEGAVSSVGEIPKTGAPNLAAGWRVLAVFVATISAFLLRPLPMGPVTLIALATLCVSGTLTLPQALSGYAR